MGSSDRRARQPPDRRCGQPLHPQNEPGQHDHNRRRKWDRRLRRRWRKENAMVPPSNHIGPLVLCLLALLLAAPLRAAPLAPPPHPTMVLQVGHSAGITTLAYSPDGRTLVTAGADEKARLWDVPS